MARSLQSLGAWEELAEDPFRGLRAGPATFSPFLFPAKETVRKVFTILARTISMNP